MDNNGKYFFDSIEKELRYYKQSYEDLQKILENSFDQITIADGKGTLLMSSINSKKYFGIDSQNIIGRNVKELESKGILKPSITKKVLETRKKQTIIQDTGTGKRLMVTGLPMFDENGELMRILNISQDISEIEELKHKLMDTQEILDWFRDELLRTKIPKYNFVKPQSLAMGKVSELVNHVCNLDVTVLILGETGVGKGFIAETIHNMGNRRNSPFINVNCGAIPHNLLESELFGYVKGAFTGASEKGRRGFFELANNGTIFLDEIAETSKDLQVKLLHVLENKKIYRIGDDKPIHFNARVIAASNKELLEQVQQGFFRKDLYYRLNVVPIYIPPLRERLEDIFPFIEYFLKKFNDKYGYEKRFSPSAYEVLFEYDWPGNIRELGNLIERILVTSSGTIIDRATVQDAVHMKQSKARVVIPEIVPLKQAVLEVERQLLKRAFHEFKTTRRMAEALQIDQSTVVKKIKVLKESRLWDE